MGISEEFDVFISYRRADGGTVARMLNKILTERGFKCFLDDEKIGVENYVDRIRAALENSANFVALITPSYLESVRVDNPEDWVRQEIEIALSRKSQINIVPLFVNGTPKAFRQDLPISIDRIRNENAFELKHDNFDLTLEKLISTGFKQTRKDLMIKSVLMIMKTAETGSFDDDFSYISGLAEWLNGGNQRDAIKWLVNSIQDEAKELFRRIDIKDERFDITKYLEGSMSLIDMKYLCQHLGIESRGFRQQLQHRLAKWLTDPDFLPSTDKYEAVLQKTIQDLGLSPDVKSGDLPLEIAKILLPNDRHRLVNLTREYAMEKFADMRDCGAMHDMLINYSELSLDEDSALWKELPADEIKFVYKHIFGLAIKTQGDAIKNISKICKVFDINTSLD